MSEFIRKQHVSFLIVFLFMSQDLMGKTILTDNGLVGSE